MGRQHDQRSTRGPAGPLRIALYSHDTCGLGHMRRNLLIAETLVRSLENVDILLLTGAREVAAFRYPAGVDAVTLPSLYKEANETYKPRSLSCDTSELISMRSRLIKTSLEMFRPDVFIVDKVPRGTMGELDESLAYLAGCPGTKCVLGLRDILDQPHIVQAEWSSAGNIKTVERLYDAVWVYGDAQVYDACDAYGFPDGITRKTTYTGYLDPTTRLHTSTLTDRDRALLKELGDRFFMCAVGGGQDGSMLAEAFAHVSFPEGVKGLIVTGPHMPADAVQRINDITAARPDLKYVSFLPEPVHFYRKAERVVTMGGYNTTLEIVGLGVSALLVPRIDPREEQLIRSRSLQALGLLDMLHPDALSAAAIEAWLASPAPPHSDKQRIDMDGLKRIPELIFQLDVDAPSPALSPKTENEHAIA